MGGLQTPDFEDANTIKADFSNIYLRPDPREYYRVLYGLDYVIPDLAKGIFRNLIEALEQQRGRAIKVLDLGCSYGNNAALIRYPLDIDRLAQRYRDLAGAGLTPAELIELDRCYFKSWPEAEIEIIGLDVSDRAVKYAQSVGLLDHGLAINLETEELPRSARRMLRDVDLIISTGCIGYVTERTLRQILGAIEGPSPWVASFVLRMFPYVNIADELGAAGLATEKLDGVTFVQRRFHSAAECTQVLDALGKCGVDTRHKEEEGLLHAEFFLSRPAEDIAQVPLDTIATVTSGAHRLYGRRYRRGSDQVIRLTR